MIHGLGDFGKGLDGFDGVWKGFCVFVKNFVDLGKRFW